MFFDMRFYNGFLGPKGCFEDEGFLLPLLAGFQEEVNGECKGSN